MEDLDNIDDFYKPAIAELKNEAQRWVNDEVEEINFAKIENLKEKIFKNVLEKKLKYDENFGIFYTKVEMIKRVKEENLMQTLQRKLKNEQYDQKSLKEMINLILHETRNRVIGYDTLEKSLKIFSKILDSKGAFFTLKKDELVRQKNLEKESAILKQKNNQLINQVEDLRLSVRKKEEENTRIIGSLFSRDVTANNFSKIGPNITPFDNSPWLKSALNNSCSKFVTSGGKENSAISQKLRMIKMANDDSEKIKEFMAKLEEKDKEISKLRNEIERKDVELEDKDRLLEVRNEVERHKEFSSRLSTDGDFFSNLNDIRGVYGKEIDYLKDKISKEKIFYSKKIEQCQKECFDVEKECERRIDEMRECYQDQIDSLKEIIEARDASIEAREDEYVGDLRFENNRLKLDNKEMHEKIGKMIFTIKKKSKEKEILINKIKRLEKNFMESRNSELDLYNFSSEKHFKSLVEKEKEIVRLSERNEILRTKNLAYLSEIKEKNRRLEEIEKQSRSYQLILESNIKSKNTRSEVKIKELCKKISKLNNVVEVERSTIARLKQQSTGNDKHLKDEIDILHKIFTSKSRKKRNRRSFTLGNSKQDYRKYLKHISERKVNKTQKSIKSCKERRSTNFSFFDDPNSKMRLKTDNTNKRDNYHIFNSKRRMSLNEYSKINTRPSMRNDHYYTRTTHIGDTYLKNLEKFDLKVPSNKHSEILKTHEDFLNKQKMAKGGRKSHSRCFSSKKSKKGDISFNIKIEQSRALDYPRDTVISIGSRRQSGTFFETGEIYLDGKDKGESKRQSRNMKKKFKSIFNNKDVYSSGKENCTVKLKHYLGKSESKSMRNPRRNRFFRGYTDKKDQEQMINRLYN